MSYMNVLGALEEGDYVTFNDSGGAIGKVPPELCTQSHTNSAIQIFLNEGTGEWWRVIKDGDDLVMEYDRDSRHADAPHDWKRYDTIETIELVAESGDGNE